jgi:hypothetical protein
MYKTIVFLLLDMGLDLGVWEKRRLVLFEDRVVRRELGPKRNQVTGDWRRLSNEELHEFYSSTIIMVTKSNRRRAWQVARIGRREIYTGFLRMYEEKSNFKDLGVDGQNNIKNNT